MAHVIAVNISKNKGEIKHPIDKGYFEKDHGLVGDAHAGNWHRQVSLLGQESINKMSELGIAGLCSGKFAENITTQGLELFSLKIGTRLKIGGTFLEVTQIGKKCHAGNCEIFIQVGDCIMPREGIFARVLAAGWVSAGDVLEVLTDED